MESCFSSPCPDKDSANACSHSPDKVTIGITPSGPAVILEICRARRERQCSVINIRLCVTEHASETPSKIVGKSRIDTRSFNRFCKTR